MRAALRGVFLAALTVAVAAALPPERALALLALLLAFAAAVYVGIAEAGPDRSERRLQWFVALGFVGLALLGLLRSPLVLAGAWLLHAAWDWRNHRKGGAAQAAPAYPVACLAYDLVVAAFLCILWYVGG